MYSLMFLNDMIVLAEEEAEKAVLMAKVGSLVKEYHQREAEEPPKHEAEIEWGVEWKKLAETSGECLKMYCICVFDAS